MTNLVFLISQFLILLFFCKDLSIYPLFLMSYMSIKNSMLHRLSRRIIRTALLISSSWVDADECATVWNFLLFNPSSAFSRFLLLALSTHSFLSDSTPGICNSLFSSSDDQSGSFYLLKTRYPVKFIFPSMYSLPRPVSRRIQG